MADCSSFAARMTKPCRFFGTPSGCRFGNDCRFFHQITQPGRAEEHTGDRGGEATRERNEGDTSEVARTRSEADGARAKNDGNPKQLDALCRYFQRNGGCARGDNCHFAHVKSAAKKFKGPRLPRVKSKLKETPTDISEKTIPIMKKLVRQPDEEEVDRQQPVETASLQSVVSDVLRPCKEASNGHVQAVESILTNQHSENVDPEPDKPSSKHLTPFGKDGIKREAATDKNLAEFSKLRSMEIQLLKRRFGGRNGCFEEVLENVKFKVKFKPTDPDWPFKLDAVYLTIWFPEDYPKEIFKIFLSEEQGLPQGIVKYANKRIMQWTKNQHHTGMTQGVHKLYFRPFLRWFDRNLESFFIDGERQTRKGFKMSMAGTLWSKISPLTRSCLKTDIEDSSMKVAPSKRPPESCTSEDAIDVSKLHIKLVEDKEKDTAAENHNIVSQQTEQDAHLYSVCAADTASATPLESRNVQIQDIGGNMGSQNTQDLCGGTIEITHDKQDKDGNDESKSLCGDMSVVGTTTDSNISPQRPTNASESGTSLTSETLSVVLNETGSDAQESRMLDTLNHDSTAARLKNGELDTGQSSSSVPEDEIFEGSRQPHQPQTSYNQSDKVPSDNFSANAVKRGIEIQFRRLDLDENTVTLRAVKLSLTLECARCHQRNDEQLSGLGPSNRQCSRCYSVLSVAYNPAVIHQFSSVAGFLDLNGCVPFDVVLPESEFLLGCLQCSKETSIKGLQYGTNKSWCRHCHQKLGFTIQSTRFLGVQMNSETAASLRKSAVSTAGTKPKKQSQSLGLKEGQPLPGNGTCKHYKKSYRWLRFPCCGKCYACDLCHEENEAHEMKFATRMVCGFCSTEQPYSQHPCTACKAAVTKTHSAHWEGGKGCRDKIHMSRNDDQKYKQLGKTISRKAQKQSQPKGKGKARK